MKPVDQTKFAPAVPDDEPGNCFAACIASILECDLDEVPQPTSLDTDDWAVSYWPRVAEFLKGRGMTMIYIPTCENPDQPGVMFRPWIVADRCERLPRYYAIYSGKSPRCDALHAVVGDMVSGEMVHDPHPSRDGIESLDVVELLVPLSEVER